MGSAGVALRLVDVDVPAVAPGSETETRLLDATLVLVARWGVHKTALGDVAKEAGCSRATLYRVFPGGKAHLLASLAEREIQAYVGAIVEAIETADDLHDALTRGLVVAPRLLRDHPAAQFIIEHEPELLLPFLGFHQVEHLYRQTADAVGPSLERFVAPDRAVWAAEWSARLFISYQFTPDDHVELANIDHANTLIGQFVLPAFPDQPRPVAHS